MASLIEGYSYDIFISYRQKDNKGDKWVSEFVFALKTELESTFKEDISIYFDENPHDRLQETYNVNKSLEDKLNCLIFIPILSRTYCDPKSYAWQYEFMEFIRLTQNDRYGRDVKLRNGNVTSRILPVKIHELEADDVMLFENETGNVIRTLDFVFKTSTGVNRPLRAIEDHPNDNLNKTFYRDQVNKVANLTKEIISGLQSIENSGSKVVFEKISMNPFSPPKIKSFGQNKMRRTIVLSSIVIFLVSFWLIFQYTNKKSLDEIKSIAVLPFSDFSENHDQEYFSNGMMEEILNQLAKIHDLEVISRTSSMIYKDSKLPLKNIARDLGVENIVEGSVQRAGNRIRITVQLIDGKTEKHLWSESYDRDMTDIFSVQTEISLNIARELKSILTSQEEDLIRQIPSKNLIAYDCYLMGIQNTSDLKWDKAIEMFTKAVELDSDFTLAFVKRASLYSTIYFTKGDNFFGEWRNFNILAKADLEKALKIDPELIEVKFEKAEQLYRFDRKHDEALEILEELKPQMPNNSSYFSLRSFILRRKGQWEESLNDMQKSILLDPLDADKFNQIGHTYRLLRKYSEAVDYFKKAKTTGPSDLIGFDNFFVILQWKGDLSEAVLNSTLTVSNLGKNPNLRDNYFYYSRQFDKLIDNAAAYEDQFNYIPRSLNLAHIYFLKSDLALSRLYADSAIAELNHKIEDISDDERFFASLGYAFAYKGDNKKSIEYALRAVQLKPLKLDAWQGYKKEEDLIRIYTLIGEYDRAMDLIEILLTIPGDLSVPLLRIDPAYDNLRNIPRFQRILGTEFKTNYK